MAFHVFFSPPKKKIPLPGFPTKILQQRYVEREGECVGWVEQGSFFEQANNWLIAFKGV